MYRSYPRSFSSSSHRPIAQQGVALVVAMILLVVMTLLGLGAMRSVTLEEKMASNTFDRSVSFQSAEATLREAEALLEPPAVPPTPAAGACPTAGICGAPVVGATPRWEDAAFTGWADATPVVSGGITVTPQYIIEYLGNTFPCNLNNLSNLTCRRYRVTARSNANADRASVTLQSVYATP
nr:PilX N-terminal domain-containing pilus assembly protein [Hydrogenophaga sp.]